MKKTNYYVENKNIINTIDIMLSTLNETGIVDSFEVDKGKVKSLSICLIDDEEEKICERLYKCLLEKVFKMPIFKKYHIIVDYEDKILLIKKENKRVVRVSLEELDNEFDVFNHLGKEILHQLKIVKEI